MPWASAEVDAGVVEQPDERGQPLDRRLSPSAPERRPATPRLAATSAETSARRAASSSPSSSRSSTSRSRSGSGFLDPVAEQIVRRPAPPARRPVEGDRPGCGAPRAARRRSPAAWRSRRAGTTARSAATGPTGPPPQTIGSDAGQLGGERLGRVDERLAVRRDRRRDRLEPRRRWPRDRRRRRRGRAVRTARRPRAAARRAPTATTAATSCCVIGTKAPRAARQCTSSGESAAPTPSSRARAGRPRRRRSASRRSCPSRTRRSRGQRHRPSPAGRSRGARRPGSGSRRRRTAASTSPEMPEPPMPATTTARGPGVEAERCERGLAAAVASARTCAAEVATARSISVRIAPRRARRRRRGRVEVELRVSRTAASRLAGLVDQQDRDVVAHRVGVAAAGADQLVGRVVDAQPPRQFGQARISSSAGSRFTATILVLAGCGMVSARMMASTSSRSAAIAASSAASTLSRSSGSVLDGAEVEPRAVRQLDGQPVEVVDRRHRRGRRTPRGPPRPRRPGRRPRC